VFRWRFLLRATLALCLTALVGLVSSAQASPGDHPKLDRELNQRANSGVGQSRVIVTYKAGWDGSTEVKRLGGKLGRQLTLIGAQVVEVSNGQLKRLADHPAVASIHWDRPLASTMNRVAVTTGARGVQQVLGFTGAGVGVAVIDSGVANWHDDLTYNGGNSVVKTSGGQRVAAFVDFVNGRSAAYDDNGHGSHVAGIIAGNGYDSRGTRAGIAPDAHLVSLKVLDGQGKGVISNVIAALDYIVATKSTHNIRVANLSVGAAVTESFNTDPLTIAAKRAVDAGIVIVTAAGNIGKAQDGKPLYGGITAPGNAPWVITVGAYSHEGTVTRVDDVMAGYSSRGPTAIDFQAKPDLVAPGTGIVSLATPGSLFYSTKSAFLLKGNVDPGYKPYLSLSGTSMAAPVVAGTVALMMQANPNLTPNLVKAVLQYTAQLYPNYNALTQGAGFLNSRGAVDLARYFATAHAGDRYPYAKMWSQRILWGNHRLGGGAISPTANAWHTGVVWGAAVDEDGDNIVWGTVCASEDCDNIVWGTTEDADNIVWGTTTEDGDNIVWGTSCDPNSPTSNPEDCDNIVWGTAGEDDDNIVWGTDCGGEDCDNIVWGTAGEDADNIVWGTADDADHIAWATNCNAGEDCDNIVWGTSGTEAVLWGNSAVDEVLFDDPDVEPAEFDPLNWDAIFSSESTTTTGTSGTTSSAGGL
jgi:serine protease AprX